MGQFDHPGLVSAVQYSGKAAFLAEKPPGDLTLNETQAACLFALGYKYRRTLAAREGCAIPKPVQ
ncbi:hypothetical protein LCM27_08175 [Ruegeria marisrubri]|uniref:hypothetical protein n=1 Tax=Ruegeria marisrubri TaxID=1685379 RepID=UPI001CD5DBD4|nr:hypothetical protein [Ruegeria marisrubri]MCA0906372.1 hypothetical protein [Ruegeria marisrubri]